MDVIVEKLTKKYGETTVLNDFSSSFTGGKVSVIMGKSGIGKTTLLNCIAGLADYEGKIYGVQKTSYVFQEDRLIPNLSVYDNLDFILDKNIKKEEKPKIIKEILCDVELVDKATELPETLSGGQKKRVSLARAYIAGRNVILLDEPLNSLDTGLKAKMYALFIRLTEKFGSTAIYCTHDIDEALSVADEIKIMDGKGIIYSHVFETEKSGRDVTDAESVEVRKKIINILSE
ncbi:MAG TPA: ABC transporter [Clostridiales bacterium]|nr:ABC transporter [Clostridiales bacterium]